MIISPVRLFSVVAGYVIADQSITYSVVITSPGSRVVPQRNPGENAISAPLTDISASRITWSTVPLKLPRRYSRPSLTASFSSSFDANGARAFAMYASISRSAGRRFEKTGSRRYVGFTVGPDTSMSSTPRYLPLQPALATRLPSCIMIACGSASWVWPPRIASMPFTRCLSFTSTSMPLCESRTTTRAPLARTSSTRFCSSSSLMPKVHSGTK